MIKRFLALFIFSCLLLSCIEVDTDITMPRASVFSLVSPSDSIISVFVGRVYERGEPILLDSGKYLSEAKVSIRSSTVIKDLMFNNKTKFYEGVNNSFIQPDEPYTLNVEVEGLSIQGATRVPAQYALTVDTLNKEVNVSWKKGSAFGNYELTGAAVFEGYFQGRFSWGAKGGIWDTADDQHTGETVTAPAGIITFPETVRKVLLNIRLRAYDPHTYDFIKKEEILENRTELFKRLEAPVFLNSNLGENAVGLFGSYTESKTEISIEK